MGKKKKEARISWGSSLSTLGSSMRKEGRQNGKFEQKIDEQEEGYAWGGRGKAMDEPKRRRRTKRKTLSTRGKESYF